MMISLDLWEVIEMDEYEDLLMEKEIFERMYRRFHDKCKNCDKPELADTKNENMRLFFAKTGENTYRVMNKETGRFHNIELGIDEVV